MKGVNRFATIMAAIMLVVVIASLQLAWNLRTAAYLESVARRADTHSAIARALPEYASKKLPNPEVAKQTFATNVSTSSVKLSLQSLYESLSQAYNGKTDMVEMDLGPITRPVKEAGYEIPPGTVFAQDTLQIGGIAPVLRTTHRVLWPSLVLLIMALSVVMVLATRRSPVRAVRSVFLIAALILAGLYVATLAVPTLVSSLVSSSSLDAALRDILLTYTNVVVTDTGHYYVAWIIVLLGAALVLSIVSGLMHRRKRPRRSSKIPQSASTKEEEL